MCSHWGSLRRFHRHYVVSGPGIALKGEAIGLASITDALVIDIQRGGPSTGLPTKTEQATSTSPLDGTVSPQPRARRPDAG